jgi:tol-pal system protein YbgF
MQTDLSTLQRRVEALEQQQADIRSRFDQSTQVAGEAVLGFNQMQQEVAILQGKVDEMAHQQLTGQQITMMRRQLARQFEAIDGRLSALEKKAGIKDANKGNLSDFAGGGEAAIPAPIPGGKEKPTEDDLFKEGVALYNQGNLEAAKSDFRDFLTQFKKSAKRSEAQYYLASCIFKQRNWEESILEFDNLVSQYPQSKRIPEAYLNMGIAFYEKGQMTDAKLFLDKVVEQFPKSREAEVARKKLKTIK